MKRVWVVCVVGIVFMTGCARRPPAAPPAPPVAPETPPPAPPPQGVEPPPVVDEETRLRSMPVTELERLGLFPDVYFDYDRSDVRDDARPVLARNAEVLRRYDFLDVTVEGHCDERGTIEYNLALGERRASAVRDYLVSLGVPGDRLRASSHGKEAPVCAESTDECWSRNRRAHLAVTGTRTARP